MSDRVKDDDTLRGEAERAIIHNAIVVINIAENGNCQFRIHTAALDPDLNEPRLFGILLSDLVDHLAVMYRQTTGRDERALRELLIKTLRDEDRFKQQDPARGQIRGTTVWPTKN